MKKLILAAFLCAAILQMGGVQPARAEATNPAVMSVENKLMKAKPLPLSAVRLTGGPLKAAQDADIKYLLTIDLDRTVSLLRVAAGLQPKEKNEDGTPAALDGWDADGRQLTGHIAGHYLSAVAYMFAATGNAEFKRRSDYLVDQLKEIQDAQKDGYIGAQKDRNGTAGKQLYAQLSQGDIRSGGFDLNGLWSPWYVEAKIFAGLRDAYRETGNKKALDVEIKFAAWVKKTLDPLTDAQIQRMLATEYGGMGEVMVDLYADTGDKQWLDLSYKFEQRSFSDPLARHQDILGGKHGNTNIPKMVGSADRFGYTGDAADIITADYFFDAVVQHHTYATGGNGDVENFPLTDQLAAVIEKSPAGRTDESCNVYNMLKLERRLFSFDPDPHYADFQERALFNHVLGSIDPANGQMCYMVPIGQNVVHEYQGGGREGINAGMTCCVGSGMESHALHGDGVYYEADKKLWVNIYTPTTAEWATEGVKLKMDTDMPEGQMAKLTITEGSPKEYTIALRRPSWTTADFKVTVNGQPVEVTDPNAAQGFGRRGGTGAGAAAGAGNAATSGTQGRRGRGFGAAGAGAAGANGATSGTQGRRGRGNRGGGGAGGAQGARAGAGAAGGAAGAGAFGGAGQAGRGRGRGGATATGTQTLPASSYVEITRTWKSGDVVELTVPKTLRYEATPDNPNMVALMWGPLVLGQDLGSANRGQGGGGGGRRGGGAPANNPVLVSDSRNVSDFLKPSGSDAGMAFTTVAGRLPSSPNAPAAAMSFVPFYRLHEHRYSIYMDLYTPQEWSEKSSGLASTQASQAALAANTAGAVTLGEMQSETDNHYLAGDGATVETVGARHGRKTGSWFSMEVPVGASLVATYYTGGLPEAGAKFNISVDGTLLKAETIQNSATPGMSDVTYALPATVTAGKQRVTIRFEAAPGSTTAGVFGLRTLRAQ